LLVRVECYSGRKLNERPLRFYLQDRCYAVEEVVDQWYGPEDTWFRVRASDGHLYVLRYTERDPEPVWTLEAFSAVPQPPAR
jgi:hypothetical protein